MTVYVETAPHEFAANYLFNERGLAPFFAVDRRVKRGGGSALGTFTHDGEEWQARLYYQESGSVRGKSLRTEGRHVTSP